MKSSIIDRLFPSHGVMVDWQIEKLINQGLTDSSWKDLINPASLDVTLGDTVKVLIPPYKVGDIREVLRAGEMECLYEGQEIETDSAGNFFFEVESEHYLFRPSDRILAQTEQYFKFPSNISGEVRLKSSRGREFYEHLEAGWIDPGFEGNLTLELVNLSYTPLPLKTGLKIGQVVFHRHTPAKKPYQGKYKGDKGVSISRDNHD